MYKITTGVDLKVTDAAAVDDEPHVVAVAFTRRQRVWTEPVQVQLEGVAWKQVETPLEVEVIRVVGFRVHGTQQVPGRRSHGLVVLRR